MSKGDGLGMPAKAEEIKTEPEGRVICNVVDTYGVEEEEFEEYIKTTPVQALQVDEKFHVDTKYGLQHGEPGDYLIINEDGEMYPCPQDTFEETYEKSKINDCGCFDPGLIDKMEINDFLYALDQLNHLYEQNIINEDTFKAKKEKLLSYI